MGTATLIRPLEGFAGHGFGGHASLYRLAPPLIDWGGYYHDFVVVSATVIADGLQTCLFAADESGEVTNWHELDGSMKGTLDHTAALNAAGYEVAP